MHVVATHVEDTTIGWLAPSARFWQLKMPAMTHHVLRAPTIQRRAGHRTQVGTQTRIFAWHAALFKFDCLYTLDPCSLQASTHCSNSRCTSYHVQARGFTSKPHAAHHTTRHRSAMVPRATAQPQVGHWFHAPNATCTHTHQHISTYSSTAISHPHDDQASSSTLHPPRNPHPSPPSKTKCLMPCAMSSTLILVRTL